jgi:2,4-dienoyl-CoA reductase-like NADH-dependent reductase (Old Yellow Enzyme family)
MIDLFEKSAINGMALSNRNAVGRDYPALAKINSRDFVENGLYLDDSIKAARMLEKAGIDAIETSGGLLNNPNVMRTIVEHLEVHTNLQE